MDFGTALSVAQTLFAALQCSELKEFCSLFGYKSELENLQNTVSAINSVLEDAAAKQDALSHQERNYIEELKDAIYDADDVLDEFFTLMEQRKQAGARDKVSFKVRSFLSRFKPVALDMSRKVKKVRKKLDAIAMKSSQFSFKVDYKPIRFRKEETCSYVYENDVVGREADVEKIVGVLLDSNIQRDVSFLTIVGIGGLGKTALAQLVYNDKWLASAFMLRLWVCVSDQDQKQLNVFDILGKILESAIGGKHDASTLDQVQKKLREQLDGRKYLLVLDDLWTENYDQWRELSKYLVGGSRGSWVLVTTRSGGTARVVGNGPTYELQGLSVDDSWHLFKRTAFEPEEGKPLCDDLVNIGKEIVKRCAYVPLAIRAIGSLLYGQPKKRWQSVKELGLTNINESESDIKPILKLSYHNLKTSLKSCFTYCAIFPKDHVIEKEMLINLWMAQGYVIPSDKCQSLEEVGEEYFSILLRRCFFQDVCKDAYGEILSCKIHDLMHDIAQEVADKEICEGTSNVTGVNNKVRHISLMNESYTKDFFAKTPIRTYLQLGDLLPDSALDQFGVGKLLANWTCLRTLDLSQLDVESLPESIGKLLHLRYLDLSGNYRLKELPKTITKLHNLQTLRLLACWALKELPKDVSKLINLSTLDLLSCYGLKYLPSGIGKLTHLHTLSQFIVGRSSSSGKQGFDGLDDLKALNNLKGRLYVSIQVLEKVKYVKEDHGGGAYLRSKEHLTRLHIGFHEEERCESVENGKLLLEELQPHSNLRELSLRGYHWGVRMPRWLSEGNLAIHLPNLVRFNISCCRELQCLPSLEKLRHLKYMKLEELPNVEYLGDDYSAAGAASMVPESSERASFFPCLEELYLCDLPKLKGWGRKSGPGLQNDHKVNFDDGSCSQDKDVVWASSPCLSQLTKLCISNCSRMIYVPVCPRLEDLAISDSNRTMRLLYTSVIPSHQLNLSSSHMLSLLSESKNQSKSWKLTISNLQWLKSIPMEYFQPVVGFVVKSEMVESLAGVRELFQTRFLSSLRFLQIDRCPNLRSLGGWLECFSALERLRIDNCPNLFVTNSLDEEDGIPWRNLPPSLHSLELFCFENLENLPKGMQYWTSLQSLKIWNCPKLEALPNWMSKLTSLQKLQFRVCSKLLMARCSNPNGEDWPLIKHIPHIFIRDMEGERKNPWSADHAWVDEDNWCWQSSFSIPAPFT